MVQWPRAGNSKELLTPLKPKAKERGKGRLPVTRGCLPGTNPANSEQYAREWAGEVSVSALPHPLLFIFHCTSQGRSWRARKPVDEVPTGKRASGAGRRGSWMGGWLKSGTAFSCLSHALLWPDCLHTGVLFCFLYAHRVVEGVGWGWLWDSGFSDQTAVLSFRASEAVIETTVSLYSHMLWKCDFPFCIKFQDSNRH